MVCVCVVACLWCVCYCVGTGGIYVQCIFCYCGGVGGAMSPC